MIDARRRHGVLALAGLLLAGLFAAQPGAHVSVRAQAGCEATAISAPLDGDTLSGSIEVLGSASIPDFNFYKVEWATQADPEQWIAVSEVVNSPVRNDRLDTWRTEGLPDGAYRLKLTVVDSSFGERCRFLLQSLRLANESPVPTFPQELRDPIPTAPATEASVAQSSPEIVPTAAETVVVETTASPEPEDADIEETSDSEPTDADTDEEADEQEAPDVADSATPPPTADIGATDDPSPTDEPRATMEPVLPRSSVGERALPAGVGRTFALGLGLALLAGLGLVVLLLRR